MKTLVLLHLLGSVPTGCDVKNIAFSFSSNYFVVCDCGDGAVAFEGHADITTSVLEEDEDDEP